VLLLLYHEAREGRSCNCMDVFNRDESKTAVGIKSLQNAGGSYHIRYLPSALLVNCDIFLWHCWLGDRKGIRHVKSCVLVCWWWRFDWSFACFITPVFTPPPIIFCSPKNPEWRQSGTSWPRSTGHYIASPLLSVHLSVYLSNADTVCKWMDVLSHFLPSEAMCKRRLCCRPVSVCPSVCHVGALYP